MSYGIFLATVTLIGGLWAASAIAKIEKDRAVDLECKAFVQCLNESDVDALSGLIYAECGICPEYEKYRTGSVVINRASDPRWPNSIDEVIYQPGQFAGIYSPHFKNKKRCRQIAVDLLSGIGVTPDIFYFCRGDNCHINPVIIQDKYHKFGR